MEKTSPFHTPPGIVTQASPHPVLETLQRLEAAVHARGLTVFAHIDHGENAQQAGLTMNPAHVLIFGNARAGTPLMVAAPLAAPLAALDLPLKVLIWQDDDGKAWVSYASPGYLIQRYGLPAAMEQNIAGIAGIVAATIQAA